MCCFDLWSSIFLESGSPPLSQFGCVQILQPNQFESLTSKVFFQQKFSNRLPAFHFSKTKTFFPFIAWPSLTLSMQLSFAAIDSILKRPVILSCQSSQQRQQQRQRGKKFRQKLEMNFWPLGKFHPRKFFPNLSSSPLQRKSRCLSKKKNNSHQWKFESKQTKAWVTLSIFNSLN